MDNEPGNELLHNHGVFQRFVDHLRTTYGDVETLNREWGLVYWSHRLVHLGGPVDPGRQRPAPVRRRLAARSRPDQTTEFIGWQADIVREYARGPTSSSPPASPTAGPRCDDDELTERLDVAAGNPYYVMQDALALPDRDHDDAEQHWKTTGVWALYQTADRMFSSRQAPFLVTETNAMSIGTPWDNRPAYDGQWRQAAWALVARGAQMIEYWHWHTLHFGAETYWGGVLPHSGRPGRTYAELARLGAELDAAGAARRRPRTRRRHHHGLLDAEQVAHAEVPAAGDRGRRTGRRGVPRHLRSLLPRRIRRRPAGAHRPRPAVARPER